MNNMKVTQQMLMTAPVVVGCVRSLGNLPIDVHPLYIEAHVYNFVCKIIPTECTDVVTDTVEMLRYMIV